MPAQDQISSLNLYANLLEEIKLRIDSINHCTLGLSGFAPPFVKDYCYLQIRMICELVALCCLVAHGDIQGTSGLKRAWSAQKIMEALERLHPQFYPQPVKQIKKDNGFHLEGLASPLPKSEFLKLYHKCDEALHRGSLRKLLKGQFPKQINYPEITEKAQKLNNLLSHHMLVMKNGQQMFIAMLHNKNDNMKAQVAIAEALKPS